MIRTPFNELLGIDHPVALAGMGGGTSPGLAAAVSQAGGLGILGVTGFSKEELDGDVAQIRRLTPRPFGLNLLLHLASEEELRNVLEARPAVLSTAWPREGQDLTPIFAAAHECGAKVVHMVPTVKDALAAARAGADVIVAQGIDGGGHVGGIGTVVIVPMVVRAVAPIPVLAAGGIADGHGLAAMLALGASGVLLGTRFLATPEAPIHEAYKRAIVDSDATDTMVTDVGDIMLGNEWPGALARVLRNRAIERWLGRVNDLRRQREEVVERMVQARRVGDVGEGVVYWGQSAGLIGEIVPAGQVVTDMVAQAETVLSGLLPHLPASAKGSV